MAEINTCFRVMGLCFSNKVDLALIVSVLIFVLTIFYNSNRERKKLREVRKRYLFALREEIALNVRALNSSISGFPSKEMIQQFLRTGENARPVMIFGYSVIFRSRTEVLQDVTDLLIKNIIEFYGRLESIGVAISAIEGKAWETISYEGRGALLEYIIAEQKIAAQQGETIHTAIALELRLK